MASLVLGKSLDRSYNLRIPFLTGFYHIGIFFNKKSPFLLFSADFENLKGDRSSSGIKLSMFKNIRASKFCQTFIDLHSYRGDKLDIIDQFKQLKSEFYGHINFILNESIILSKYDIEDRSIFDSLTVFGFEMSGYAGEFIFLLVERQNIIKSLKKKMVRSSALQIATSGSLAVLEEFYQEGLLAGREGGEVIGNPEETIHVD